MYNIEQFSQTPNLLAVVGGVHTPVVLAEIDPIHEKNILMLVPWAAGTPIIDNGHSPNNIFRVSVRDAEAASVLINHVKYMGLSNIALVLERTGWGRSNLESLTQAASNNDIDITATHWINWQQKDFSEDIAAIKSAKAEAITLVTNVPEGVVVLDEMAKQGIASLPVVSHWESRRVSSPLYLLAIANYNVSAIKPTSTTRKIQSKSLLEAYYSKYGLVMRLIGGVTGLAHAYDLT